LVFASLHGEGMESASRSGVEEGGESGTYGAALRLSWSEREGGSARGGRRRAEVVKSRQGRGKDKAEGGERGGKPFDVRAQVTKKKIKRGGVGCRGGEEREEHPPRASGAFFRACSIKTHPPDRVPGSRSRSRT
jgi:hypothetical protein